MLQAAQRLHVDVRAPGDTMTVLHPPTDITPVERVIRWFFSVPQWVQIFGAVVAILIALVAFVLVWRNTRAIVAWARERHLRTPIFWKAVIGVMAIAVLLGMAGSGTAFFVYSQNENQFCLSCHTLHDEVYQRFQQSRHHRVANLRCHDCHDEPLVAETEQVVKWMVWRPSAVGPHAPVPRQVCASCHVRANPDSTWQRIIATAGHSVHLLSDTAKKLHIECLTCHGVTAHRFKPAGQTCAQSGCHEQTKIQLGKMAGQTSLHCITCHQFTAPVSEAAAVTAVRDRLVPVAANCLGCHEMRRVIERFVPERDPHKGRCGDCHNPHTQRTPAAAFKSCASSGCHTRSDTLTPFHRGTHIKALANCGSCHEAHTWKVQGKACLDCHKNIYNSPARVPFPPHLGSAGDARPVVRLATTGDAVSLIPTLAQATPAADSLFSHATHKAVSCTSCHSASGPTHGSVTLRSRRDCQECHHGRTVQSLGGGPPACLHCHQESALPARPQQVTVRTSTSATTMTRTLPFAHATHSGVVCADCHTTPVTLAAATACSGCHGAHHEPARDCKTCHEAYDAHRGKEVHTGCSGSGCHTDRATLALGPARNVCVSCHAAQVNHKPDRNCATCHLVHWTPGSSARGHQ